jgi:hypothetical protein
LQHHCSTDSVTLSQFKKPFDIYTDASNNQIGGVITQGNHPIAFYSRKLTNSQCNYTHMEKELLSAAETAQYPPLIQVSLLFRS